MSKAKYAEVDFGALEVRALALALESGCTSRELAPLAWALKVEDLNPTYRVETYGWEVGHRPSVHVRGERERVLIVRVSPKRLSALGYWYRVRFDNNEERWLPERALHLWLGA